MDKKGQEELAIELTKGMLAGRGRETMPEEAVDLYIDVLAAVETKLPRKASKQRVI